MDKLKMHSVNKVDENLKKLAALFPNALTETITGYEKDENGNDDISKPIIERAIDKDILMQEINTYVVEGNEERYQFTWPDKKKSILLANSPIAKTLRPCKGESVNFDNTENLYIEGDNLDVLKLLQETYLGKVKMIYIDPPYNTGNDFVYEDDFAQNSEEYLANSGQYDEEGNRLVISIDDNEVENLKKICAEIFGESNFIAQVIWERAYAPVNLKKHFSECHDYIICYAKNIGLLSCNGLPRDEKADDRYKNPDNDPRGVWQSDNLSVGPAIPQKVYEIEAPNGRKIMPPSGRCWLYTKDKLKEMIADNRIWFGEDGGNVPRVKRFLSEVKQGLTPMTIWKYADVGHSQDAAQKLKALFDGKDYFDYPKSVNLIKRCLQLYADKDSIILDFFSGSATTAHAVMQLNAEDGGNRKFIMVQLPEETDEKSEAYKAGYKNICEIGKERIRRAGKKIVQEITKETVDIAKHGENYEVENIVHKYKDLDIGFRVLKCDSTNMKDVYYNPADYETSLFDTLTDNIKEDRTPEDLLFQVMLDLGVLLSSKIEESIMGGKKVFNVADGFLIACFDENVTDETIKEIANQKPYYFVMRDSSMASDSVAANFEQIFATYSPDTVRKVL
jgi:adenine-specific DNA-methyltransferase